MVQVSSRVSPDRISLSGTARSAPGRALIRLIETAAGGPGLVRRVAGHRAELDRGEDFWRVMMLRCGLSIECLAGALDDIPATGPVAVVANHPRGLLDLLVMGYVLSGLRGDFRLLDAGGGLDRLATPQEWPVARHMAGAADTAAFLRGGGAVGLFPAGSRAGAAPEPWRPFAARMIARSGATVVPLWFDGGSTRLMQAAGGLHATLRTGLQLRELGSRVDTPVRLAIGRPVAAAALAELACDGKQTMEFLRRATYSLAPTPYCAA